MILNEHSIQFKTESKIDLSWIERNSASKQIIAKWSIAVRLVRWVADLRGHSCFIHTITHFSPHIFRQNRLTIATVAAASSSDRPWCRVHRRCTARAAVAVTAATAATNTAAKLGSSTAVRRRAKQHNARHRLSWKWNISRSLSWMHRISMAVCLRIRKTSWLFANGKIATGNWNVSGDLWEMPVTTDVWALFQIDSCLFSFVVCRRFDSLEQLAGHVTQAHATASGSGLYYCQWERCPRSDRGFNARYKMLVHARTHTKEKPHQCSECFKSFSRAENLKIHQRSHSGEKPYICPVGGCNKAYSNSSDRFKHTRTHSTDKPYACKFPSCNKRWALILITSGGSTFIDWRRFELIKAAKRNEYRHRKVY